MDPIRVNAKFSHLPPSTLAEFKRAAAQAQDLTKREPGALQYDWFFNDDQTVCIVHEAYVDSAAVPAPHREPGRRVRLSRVQCQTGAFGDHRSARRAAGCRSSE